MAIFRCELLVSGSVVGSEGWSASFGGDFCILSSSEFSKFRHQNPRGNSQVYSIRWEWLRSLDRPCLPSKGFIFVFILYKQIFPSKINSSYINKYIYIYVIYIYIPCIYINVIPTILRRNTIRKKQLPCPTVFWSHQWRHNKSASRILPGWPCKPWTWTSVNQIEVMFFFGEGANNKRWGAQKMLPSGKLT